MFELFLKTYYMKKINQIQKVICMNKNNSFETALIMRKIDEIQNIPEKNIDVKTLKKIIKDFNNINKNTEINKPYIRNLINLAAQIENNELPHTYEQNTLNDIEKFFSSDNQNEYYAQDIIKRYQKSKKEYYSDEKKTGFNTESGKFFSLYWIPFITPFFQDKGTIAVVCIFLSEAVYRHLDNKYTFINKKIKKIKYYVMVPGFVLSCISNIFFLKNGDFAFSIILLGLLLGIAVWEDIKELKDPKKD